jgi:hypothetical protein
MKPQWWVNCKPLAAEAIKVWKMCRLMCSDSEQQLVPLLANTSRRAQNHAEGFRSGVVSMARGYPGLVHLSAAMVGPSCTRIFCQHRRERAGCESSPCLIHDRIFKSGLMKAYRRCQLGCRAHDRGSDRARQSFSCRHSIHVGARRGCLGHVVLLCTLAILHSRMAFPGLCSPL